MFSVLIPVYNHAAYVSRAITSALVDRSVSEVLLVDDGSSDGSVAVIETFRRDPRVRILDGGGVNLGAHARLNQLCRAARNEWLAVLNSDDAFVAHRFQNARQIIRSDLADLITGSLSLIDQDDRVIGQKRGPSDPEYPFPDDLAAAIPSDATMLRRLLNQNYIATTSNMIFSRTLYERVGGFADYKYVHDWDFAIRAFLLGRVAVTASFLTKYRLHPSNTIKESGILVDREVIRMICAVQEEFPALLEVDANRAALAGNRHLSAGGHAFFEAARAGRFRPDTPARPRGREELPLDAYGRRVALARAVCSLDEARSPIRVIPTCIPDDGQGTEPGDGRDVYVPSGTPQAVSEPGGDASLADLLGGDDRPAILVLSGFFAVGGVERNTVEIMRQLRDRYRFLVVTFEKHSASVGSLHHQLDALDVPAIDLGHLIASGDMLDGLEAIVAAFGPKHAWIVNGATWLVAHAGAVRLLLSAAKIVDQQVYDDKAGWIGSFWNSGILAADRFIAVNRRIRERFTQTYRIPDDRIRLIYPAIALDRVLDVDVKRQRRSALAASFGLSGDDLRIGLIGRLSPQKRVDRFLALAAAWRGRSPQVQFVVIGQGPLERQLKQFATDEDLQNVRFVTYFEHVSDIGACLDGLVISSDYEGLPIALLECMAMGIPFLSTDVGDVRHVSQEYGGGIVVDGWADIDTAFARWLEKIPDLRGQLHDSRDRLLHDFSSRTLAAEYDRLFAA